MFISGPVNILNELSKLNGIDFYGKQLLIEYAAAKSSAKSIESSKNGKRRPSPVINTYPENQAVFSSPAIVPGTKSFSEAVRTQRDKKNILFVIDKISKGIHFKEFNGFSSNGNAKMVNIPGAISKKILHYLNIHFSNSSTDTVVVHVDVNDTI